MIKFFRRFGGEVSFEQKLADLGRELPLWAQPVWKALVDWFVHWLRELKVAAEMASVDQQVAEINAKWETIEDMERLRQAEQATIGEGTDLAILVEHPPDGSKAQESLGGTIEIKSPWMDR